MGWLLKVFGWLLGLLSGKGPSQEAVQAAKAASAETALNSEVKTNEVVQKAVSASSDAVRSIDSDSKLHNYEQTDPNNRDNN